MDFNALIAELRASSESLPKDSADRSLLSSVYCNKACKVLDQVAENTDYDNTITGLWLVAAHFAEQLAYLKPVPALSELCFKLFRQCAKAVLNIQWQNLEEDSSLRQNFLASLANLHAKLVPLDFPRFRLLEGLTENPWTNPTLAKVMGGEVEETDKEEVRCYIEQEDPIILQLRVDMMLKENCEEYALNLCNSCLSHPELQSDLGVRKTQLSLLYKLGQEDKLQEECQNLSIQDAVRIIKQLQTSKTHRQICTVLAQTFMVQNWIRPSDMEANKELLRLWIRHQSLVDREQDQFKESVWAMAKLSQSTEQIIIFIDVLREECGETFLQLYVDMCIFAINVDKGQMESNKKEGNMEAAAARRSDMASICAKLSCLCHHASVKVARICALTSFALRPTEQSFTKIGTFYGQGTDCCNKCGRGGNREPSTVNPATLYEVERLLSMLRPDYLSPDQSYVNIQILCRRFLQESLKNAQQFQRQQFISANCAGLPASATTQVDGSSNKVTTATSGRPTNVFEALSAQDFQNTQTLLNKMRVQNVSPTKASVMGSPTTQHLYQSGTSRSGAAQQPGFSPAGQANKAQYVFDAERVKNKQPYGVPLEQQHQYYLIKHEKELEQRRKNAQKKREEKTQQSGNLNSQMSQQIPRLLQHQRQQFPKQPQHNEQVTQIIQTALKQDSKALQKLAQGASPGVVQAVLNLMKGTMLKPSAASNLQQQPLSQQTKPMVPSSQHVTQPLPTVSTLLKPSVQAQQLQNHHSPELQQHPQLKQQPTQQPREHSPPRRHPRPQLYAQPIIVSTSNNANPLRYQPPGVTLLNNRSQVNQSCAAPSVREKQKSESFMLAKSHVEDIRRFMQVQMSNLQQKQIAEPHQMSGSTVALANMSVANTAGHPSFNLINRPKTTVELAEQAALAKLQKQENSKPGMFQSFQQLKSNRGQGFASQAEQMLPKPNQQQFTTSISRSDTSAQLQPPQHQQHQKLLHLQQQQQQNNSFSFRNSPSPSMTANALLPSSDELSGSIMGIDDTIIKELLQDSGILANTFPDIEVDTIGEDKSRKVPDFFSMPQPDMPPVSNQIPKSSKPQLYRYATPTALQTSYSAHSTPGNSVTKFSHPRNVASASNLPGSVIQSVVSGMNKYSTLPATTISINTTSQSSLNRSLNPSVGNTFSKSNNQVPSSTQLWTNTKLSVSASPRDNISVLPKKDIKQEAKPTVDQLREMMKQEDIQGEIYMDAANNATYRCIICSFAFETLDHLREHVRNVCKPGLQSSSVYNTKIKQDRANSAKAGVETTTVFQCLRCFELCVSDAGIKQHRLTCKRVPAVPSDIKKEVANKQKVPSKPMVATKQSPNKEQQESSCTVPELPLPFPYPSLNAEAVLTSMSIAGSFISQTQISNSNVGSKPQSPVQANDTLSRPTVAAAAPSLNISSKTCSVSSTDLPAFSSVTSSSINDPETLPTSLDTITQAPVSDPNVSTDSVSVKDVMLPKNEAVPKPDADTSSLERNVNMKDIEKLAQKENSETILQPRYTEITGSGGSKFYKCGICSQTLCSLESFLVHWTECSVKNKNLLRKLELKEKICSMKPISGEVLENLIGVLAEVAAGSGTIPETISVDSEWSDEDDMLSLRDPSKISSLDSAESCEDSESASSYETEYSESQDSTSGIDGVENEKRDEWKEGNGCANDVFGSKGRKDGHEKDNGDKTEEEDGQMFKKAKRKYSEDTEDEDKSTSESEQSYLSTREAPPRLRDRKTLKPIQSFINETFNSPFTKAAVKATTVKLDEKLKETTDEEKISSESDVESDGDGLYCKVCQTSYQTKRILLQHFAGKHLQPYTVKTVADSSSYFCHLCQKTFSTFMHYMQHVPNHSVTIYEKMKAFITSRKSSQRSERIASQRGVTKRSGLIPKMAKALKSKKAATKSAVERLKQQLLAGKTQSVRDRLRIAKRKRSLPSTFTSSEDDYSSDASNTVVFKSKKSTDSENWSDGQKPITRSRNTRSGTLTSQSHGQEDNSIQSSLDQSGEDSDLGPRLARVRDDDYVLSEDFDSDGTDTAAPPTTRSRKRFVRSLKFSISKRRKISHNLESNEVTVSQNENIMADSEKYLCDTSLADSDTDSNSSVLLLSECQNGNFVPSNNKLEKQVGLCDTTSSTTDDTKTTENSRELVPTCMLFVRSLNKQQKERLKSCDLHPTVVLEMLYPGGLETSRGHDTCPARITPDQQASLPLDNKCVSALEAHEHSTSGDASTSLPKRTKNSSFLDSFLSYLNRYPSDNTETARKRSISGPPDEAGVRKRKSSCDLSQISAPSPANICAAVEAPDITSDTQVNTCSSSIHSSDNSQDTVLNIMSKFSTRQCSVNLGQKICLEDLQTNIDQTKVTAQDKSSASVVAAPTGHKARAEISNATKGSSKSSRFVSEEKQMMPVVCLKRTDQADMYAAKSLLSTVESSHEKNFSSKSVGPESKPVEIKKQRERSDSESAAQKIEQSQDKHFLADKEGSCVNVSSDALPSTSQQFSAASSDTPACTLVNSKTVECTPQTGVSDSPFSKHEGSTITATKICHLAEGNTTEHLGSVSTSPMSDRSIVHVIGSSQPEDLENTGIVAENMTGCGNISQTGCIVAQNCYINDLDKPCAASEAADVKACVSEYVLERGSHVSGLPVVLSNKVKNLTADMSTVSKCADSLITLKNCQDSGRGGLETDSVKLVVRRQTRHRTARSGPVPDKIEQQDMSAPSSAEIGKLQNLPSHDLQKSHTTSPFIGQHKTSEVKREDSSVLQKKCPSRINSRSAEGAETADEQKFTDGKDSEKTQRISSRILETKRKVKEANLSCDLVKTNKQLRSQGVQQSGSFVGVMDISGKMDLKSLGKTGSGAHSSRTNNVVDEDNSLEPHLTPQVKSGEDYGPLTCDGFSASSWSLQRQDIEQCPDKADGCQLVGGEGCQVKGGEGCQLVGDDEGCKLVDDEGCLVKGDNDCKLVGDEGCKLVDDEGCLVKGDNDCKLVGDEGCKLVGDEGCKLVGDECCKLVGDEDCLVKGGDDCKLVGDEDCLVKGGDDCKLVGDEDCLVKGGDDCKLVGDEDCLVKGGDDCKLVGDEDCLVKDDNGCQLVGDEGCQVKDDNGCQLVGDEGCQVKVDESCQVKGDEGCQVKVDESCQVKGDEGCQVKYEESCQVNSEGCQVKGDEDCQVKSDESCQVQGDEDCQVKVDESCQVKFDDGCQIKGDDGCQIKGDKSCQVKVDESCQVKGDEGCQVKCEESCQAKGDEGCKVKGDEDCQVNGDEDCQVKDDEDCQVKGDQSYEVEGDEGWQVKDESCKMKVEAGCEIKVDKDWQAGDDSRGILEIATLTETADEIVKAAGAHSSVVVSDNYKEVQMKCLDDVRLSIRQPSTSRLELDGIHSISTNPPSFTSSEKSVVSDKNKKVCPLDAIKQNVSAVSEEKVANVDLSAKEGSNFKFSAKEGSNLDFLAKERSSADLSAKKRSSVDLSAKDRSNVGWSEKDGSQVVSSKLNKTYRKQDGKVRASLNPSISLAAFIAERLTKEDLEPANTSRINQTHRFNRRQIDQDSPLDVGYRVTEQPLPVCVTLRDYNRPLEVGFHVADAMRPDDRVVECLGLVDYSSSEDEECLKCDSERINFQENERGHLCTNEDSGKALVIGRRASDAHQISYLGGADSIHSVIVPARGDGALQELQGRSKVLIGSQNKEMGCVLSNCEVGGETKAVAMACLSQCNEGIEKSVRREQCTGHELSEQHYVDQLEKKDIGKMLTEDENNSRFDTSKECIEKVHDNEEEGFHQNILGEIDSNLKDNTSQCVTFLDDSGHCQKKLPLVKKENSFYCLAFSTGGIGTGTSENFVEEGSSVTGMNASNDESQTHSDVGAAVKTSSSSTNKAHDDCGLTLSDGINKHIFGQQLRSCKERRFVEGANQLDTGNNSQRSHSDISFRILETRHSVAVSCHDSEGEVVGDIHVGHRTRDNKCEGNLGKEASGAALKKLCSELCETNTGRGVSDVGLRIAHNSISKESTEGVCRVGSVRADSELSEGCVLGNGCEGVSYSNACKVRGKGSSECAQTPQLDLFRDIEEVGVASQTANSEGNVEDPSVEVDFLDGGFNEDRDPCSRVTKDEDLCTSNSILTPSLASVSHICVVSDNNCSSQLECSDRQCQEDSVGKVLPNGCCEELSQTSQPGCIPDPLLCNCSPQGNTPATLFSMDQTSKCLTILDNKLVLATSIASGSQCDNSLFSKGIAQIGPTCSKESNTISQKISDNLTLEASERDVTPVDFAAVAEMKVHCDSEHQLSNLEEKISAHCQHSINKLYSDYTCNVKDKILYAQKQLSGSMDTSDENNKSSLIEKNIMRNVEMTGVVRDRFEMSHDQLDGTSGLGQTDSLISEPLIHTDGNKHTHSIYCCCTNNEAEGEKMSCATSQVTEHIKTDLTSKINPQFLKSEEKSVLDGLAANITDDSHGDKLDQPDSPSERKNTGNETDEEDDLSDFDLVIEDDTSYRSLSFPITLEKKNYFPSHPSSSYLTKGKIAYLSSASNAPTVSSGVAYGKMYAAQNHLSLMGQQPNLALRKPLAGAKNLRKSSHGQFVWDIDDDSDSYRRPVSTASPSVPFNSSRSMKHSSSAIEAVSHHALEALKRKHKALREKTETVPFTWDLEDFTDNSVGNTRGHHTVHSSMKAANDILSFSSHRRNVNISASKVHKKITHRKRSQAPDVSRGKMPTKFSRTSSVDRQNKGFSAPVSKELKRQIQLKVEYDNIVEPVNKDPSLKNTAERFSSSSITVDEDISFKTDSFSTRLGGISADSPSPPAGRLGGISGHETKHRRGERSHKQSYVTHQSAVAHQDEKCESSSQADDVGSPKNQPGLRSRHSSVESNISDKSVTTKRATDGSLQVSYRRSRNMGDPLTPKLKKIGLIKISKDAVSPPSPGSDCTAPLTRSSEAAIKAFNQKSLRSRGVNPVQSMHSQQSPTSKNVPQNVVPKNSPDSSSRLKGSVPAQKLSPVSSNIVRNSSTEAKTESPKSSFRKSYSSDDATTAVVKRRSPPVPVPSSGMAHAKTAVALRSRKSLTKSHHSPSSTTIFRVDPFPGTAGPKGTFKSQVVPSPKGIRTLHTPLPPGTTAVRPKKDNSKQPKWKINKETKLCRGKKQQRGPLSFKRT